MRWKFPLADESQATPSVPPLALELASKSATPREEGAGTAMEVSPKQGALSSKQGMVSPKADVDLKVTSPSVRDMEVGGASSKQGE